MDGWIDGRIDRLIDGIFHTQCVVDSASGHKRLNIMCHVWVVVVVVVTYICVFRVCIPKERRELTAERTTTKYDDEHDSPRGLYLWGRIRWFPSRLAL
jgi:hypothetical protein